MAQAAAYDLVFLVGHLKCQQNHPPNNLYFESLLVSLIWVGNPSCALVLPPQTFWGLMGSMALKVLKKTSRVIEVLGGSQATQRKLRASATAVSNWKVLDRLPWRYFFPVNELLRPLGYCVRQPSFGLTDDVIRKRRKKPPRKKTGGGRGSVKGGSNGKRHKIRKRPGAMVSPTDHHHQGTMGDLD